MMSEKLAFIFPGQGSQFVGMLGDLAEEYPEISAAYAQASAVLGYDLWHLVQQGPEALLNQTVHTQPALLVGSVALWRLWQSKGGETPTFMAGHSLGEYTALVCAEAIDFSAAIELVALRGRLMQEAVAADEGAMAAIIGLDNAKIAEICQQVEQKSGSVASPANFNATGQTVVAGHRSAVETVMGLAREAGARMAVLLPVSVPSHCRLMEKAAEQLAHHLEQVNIHPPRIAVVNNVDVACYTEPADIRSALVRQLYSPVRWVESIEFLARSGVEKWVECGPGKVLAGLNKRINSELSTISVTALI